MSIVNRIVNNFCKQTAVHWAKSAQGGIAPTYDNPVEVDVRWEDSTKEVIGQSGDVVLSSASVYCATEMNVGDYLYLGDLDDLSSSTEGPEDVSNSREIISKDKTPSKDGATFIRKYYLE